MTADFLNNPQPNSGVAHRSLSGRCDGSCAWKTLQEKYPGLLSDEEPTRLIFVKESQAGDSKLIEFDVKKVVAAWAEGKFVVPIWLDVIYGRLREKVKG